jgi:hypothetical protein
MVETFAIEETQLPEMLIAGYRMRGAYSECRIGFKKVYRRFGMKTAGPGMFFKGNPAKYLTEIQFLVTPRQDQTPPAES